MPPSIFSLVGILTRSDPNCARSRQEGFVLVFIRAGSWVAQASHQFLLFSGPVPLTWLVGSSGPSRGSHHQTLILLLLLLTCTRELVNGTGRIRRLRRGQVYLNSRYVVRVGLEVVGLRVCRQDSALISGTDLICIWYFINVDDLRWCVCGGAEINYKLQSQQTPVPLRKLTICWICYNRCNTCCHTTLLCPLAVTNDKQYYLHSHVMRAH